MIIHMRAVTKGRPVLLFSFALLMPRLRHYTIGLDAGRPVAQTVEPVAGAASRGAPRRFFVIVFTIFLVLRRDPAVTRREVFY